MTTWEYRVEFTGGGATFGPNGEYAPEIRTDDVDRLNRLGAEGWELVGWELIRPLWGSRTEIWKREVPITVTKRSA